MSSRVRPTVLLIGTDRYALDACLREDVDVVIVREPVDHDGGLVEPPDGFIDLPVEDNSNPECILAALHRAGLEHRQFAAVYTTWEFSITTAAVLGRLLGADAIAPDVALRFRDKYLQKASISSAGIPVARSVLMPDICQAVNATELPFERTVVKPVAGAGTELTRIVDRPEQLRDFARHVQSVSPRSRTFLLEEFVDADEYAADGVVVNGVVRFFALARYADTLLHFLETNRAIRILRLDPTSDKTLYDQAESVIRRSLIALGLRDGVFHMELFADRRTGTMSFSECAARRGGALIQEEVFAKFGVDLGSAALRCALGRAPDLDVKVDPKSVGTLYLQRTAGIMIGCPTPAEIDARPGVVFSRVEKPLGTVLSELDETDQRIGMALVAGSNSAELSAKMDALDEWFQEQLVVVPPKATPRELRAWQRRSWPDRAYEDRVITRMAAGVRGALLSEPPPMSG